MSIYTITLKREPFSGEEEESFRTEPAQRDGQTNWFSSSSKSNYNDQTNEDANKHKLSSARRQSREERLTGEPESTNGPSKDETEKENLNPATNRSNKINNNNNNNTNSKYMDLKQHESHSQT